MIRKINSKESYKRFSQLATYENNGKYGPWKDLCRNLRSFYFGNQWTQEEKEKLEERGQYTLTINKVRKAIKGMTGLFAAALPKYKVVAAGRSDTLRAEFANKILEWVWQNSNGITMFQRLVKKALIENIAYANIVYDHTGKVKFKMLDFDEVIVDPKSKDPLFRDAERIAIVKYMSVSKVKQLYGVDEIMLDTPDDWTPFENDATTNVYLNKMVSEDKNYVRVYETYVKKYFRQEDGSIKTQIVKETLLGFDSVFEETLPAEIQDYPIIPIFVEDTGNPYKLGEVYFLKQLQKFINKAYGVVLLNAQLTSNPKVFVRETDIPRMNIEEFEDKMARPGSLNVLTGNAEVPFTVQGQPLNSAFFNLYADAKQEFHNASLPQEILGYNDSARQNKGGTSELLDIKETVIDSMRDFVSNLEAAVVQMGKVALQYSQAYLSKENMIYIVDAERNIQSVQLNREQGIDAEDPQSIQRYQEHLKSKGASEEEIIAELNKISKDTEYAKDITYIANNTDSLNVDLFIVPGSFSPTYKMARLRLMMELYEAGAVDNKAILENAPLENKDELIQRLDNLAQAKQRIAELEEQLEILERDLHSRTNQLTNAKIDSKVSSEKLKLQKMQAEQKLKNLRDKYTNRILTKEQIMELQNKVKEIILEEKYESMKRQLEGEEQQAEKDEQWLEQVFN
jgi:hypothetical protein